MTTERRHAFLRVTTTLVLITLLSITAAWPAAAQDKQKRKPEPYAVIIGTVWGPDQRPAYGVKVKIRRADEKKARWELMSDHNGEFAQRLPATAADYVVWAEVKGQKGPVAETKVRIENDERVDIGLHLTE